jgi:AcrR family transcriptional regulator
MPKVNDEYRVAKRREIAKAALRVFERRGFHAASMADIIAESGASAGAIYGSFKNKNDIVLAVASTLVDEQISDARTYLQLDPMPVPGAIIRPFLEGMLSGVGKPDVLVQLWGEAITDDSLRRITVDIIERITGMWAAYLTAWHTTHNGLSAEDAAALAFRQAPMFVGVCQGYLLQRALRTDFDGDAYLTAAADFLPR